MNEKKSQDINKVKEENIASETREYEKHDSNNIWIKTVSKSDHWQDAHYHKLNKETYIIYKGKVLFVWRNRNGIDQCCFEEGSVVVFNSLVEHVVFMPKDTEMITLKQPSESDKYVSIKLEKYKEKIDIQNINSNSKNTILQITRVTKTPFNRKYAKYSNGYIHFDTLIWQLPTWNIVLFTGVL